MMEFDLITSAPQHWLRRAAYASLGAGALAALTGTYAGLAEAEALRLERVTLQLPNLPAGLNGLTIAQISDLHLGPWVDAERAARGVAMANSAHPDCVVLTGDLVQAPTPKRAAMLEAALTGLRAPLGVFGVLGNHDYWGDHHLVRHALHRAGVDLLDNSHRRIQVDGADLWLVGLDDLRHGRPNLPRALAGVPADGFTLLLAHEPDFADVAAHHPIAVQLSGHTHGGQVRLPGIPPVWAPYLGRKYLAGLYHVNQLRLYVNRGLGTGFPPVRINCPPEVTLIRLIRG
jgi:predicted MPP superfamily phosphohydrolase